MSKWPQVISHFKIWGAKIPRSWSFYRLRLSAHRCRIFWGGQEPTSKTRTLLKIKNTIFFHNFARRRQKLKIACQTQSPDPENIGVQQDGGREKFPRLSLSGGEVVPTPLKIWSKVDVAKFPQLLKLEKNHTDLICAFCAQWTQYTYVLPPLSIAHPYPYKKLEM